MLPADPSSASRARTFVRETLGAWGADEFEESATLLVSELVTNAILHARSPSEVSMRLVDHELWVGVSDASIGPPVRKRYGPEAATGRGMLLVERIATSWGIESSSAGKVVWFRLGPGAGEAAMAVAEADFAADLAELAGDLGPRDGELHRRPPGPRPEARRTAAPRHPWHLPGASRRPVVRRTTSTDPDGNG